jgi:hypothetical protein
MVCHHCSIISDDFKPGYFSPRSRHTIFQFLYDSFKYFTGLVCFYPFYKTTAGIQFLSALHQHYSNNCLHGHCRFNYNLILRQIWKPQGMQRLVDELLHLILPVLSILYWLLFVSKKELKWNNMWGWLLYPLVYIIYTLIRGAIWGFYPYPFVDVNVNGYKTVLINSLGITVLFIFFSLLFIGIGRKMSKTLN